MSSPSPAGCDPSCSGVHHFDIPARSTHEAETGSTREQRAAEYDVWQTSLTNPDFAAFARSCGAMGLRVGEDGLAPALAEIITDAALV